VIRISISVAASEAIAATMLLLTTTPKLARGWGRGQEKSGFLHRILLLETVSSLPPTLWPCRHTPKCLLRRINAPATSKEAGRAH
jgi:hypothetical protein